MARCGCGDSCNCVVTGGTGTSVTGNGSAANPYVVSTDVNLDVVDTDTVDLTLSGSGTVPDPFTVEADVKISADVDNCLEPGTDGGLFVPCSSGGAAAAIEAAATFWEYASPEDPSRASGRIYPADDTTDTEGDWASAFQGTPTIKFLQEGHYQVAVWVTVNSDTSGVVALATIDYNFDAASGDSPPGARAIDIVTDGTGFVYCITPVFEAFVDDQIYVAWILDGNSGDALGGVAQAAVRIVKFT